MYSILMDQKTGTYYMDPGDMSFRVYTSPELLDIHKKGVILITTDIEDESELQTRLYNAGFFRGYIDGQPYRLSKSKIYYYDRNPNEIAFAQYLLTHDVKYLELVKKSKLLTLCKLENGFVYFPTTQIDSEETRDEKFVLAYTDRTRMPAELLKKYDGWRRVRMTFDARCVVNGAFIAQ